MTKKSAGLKQSWKYLQDFLLAQEKEDPSEPFYDPVHMGGAVVITLTAMGCLYWLLWTLLVYEGGIFLKLKALAKLLFTSKTLRDLGYEGYPYAMGAFEGWIGNVVALILTIVLISAMHRLYANIASKQKKC